MLENIKAKYIIIEKIFDLLTIRHKLKIIAYNKSLQGKCSVNINNYKNNAWCYVIKEANGKYKMITTENKILIYEGDCLKGKKHGEGKLYYKMQGRLDLLEKQLVKGPIKNKYKEFIKSQNTNIDESREGIIKYNGDEYFYFFSIYLYYEGGFKNGIKNGKGKLYDDNGNLRYEGDFKNGTNDGKGKIYNDKGNLWYEGEFKNGALDGKGKLYNDKGNLWYEGEFKNGIKNGKGKEYDILGNLIFKGEFRNHKEWNGKRKDYDNLGNLVFEGEIYNGRKNGKGKEYNNGFSI